MKPRVFLLGLDGADEHSVGAALRAGRMPNLARLTNNSLRPLRSTPLPITPAAWTAAYTGFNPGKTGVLTFQRRIPNSYRGRLVSSADVGDEALHLRLARLGKSVVSVGFPMMSPPQQSSAVIISGWDSKPNAPLTNNSGAQAVLDELGYRIDDEFSTSVEVLAQGVRTRFQVLDRLLKGREWDCAMLYFGFIDGLGHRLGFGNTQTQELLAIVDEELGAFLSRIDNQPAFIVCSDHGFGSFARSFSVMQWLEAEGYLTVRSTSFKNEGMIPGVEVMDLESGLIDWSSTRAFCWESIGRHAAIAINTKGAYPRGTVSPRDAYSLTGEIIERLLSATEPRSGESLVINAQRREELFWGAHASAFPEIFIETAADTTAFIAKRRSIDGGYELEPGIVHDGRFNSHLADGLWGSSFSVDPSQQLRIEDVAPTVLAMLEAEIHPETDGENRSANAPVTAKVPADAVPYSYEEEEIVRKRLEDLGYL